MEQIAIEGYLKKFKEYLKWLESLPPEEAKAVAYASLDRAGLLDKEGNIKEYIVDR